MKKFIPLKNLNAFPAAGNAGTGVLTLDSGYRYYEIILATAGAFLTATPTTMHGWSNGILDVRLLYGNKIQRQHSNLEWSAVDSLFSSAHGVQFAAGSTGPYEKSMLFWEPYRKTYQAQDRFVFDLKKGEIAQVEVDVIVTALSSNSALEFWAVVEDLDDVVNSGRALNRTPNDEPIFQKIFRRTGIAVSGANAQINDLTKKDRYNLIDIYDPAGTTINQVTITTGTNGVIFDLTKKKNDAMLARQGITAVAGRFTIVPEICDNPMDVWNITSEKKFEMYLQFAVVTGNVTVNTAATAGASIKIITGRYGSPE